MNVTGLRAELSISAVESCPVAAASLATDETLRDVTWTTDDSDGTVERFDVSSDAPIGGTDTDTDRGPGADAEAEAGSNPETDSDPDSSPGSGGRTPSDTPASIPDGAPAFDTVFDDGSAQTLEFDRDWDDCVCERIEAVGCPVDDVRATDGRLLVQFRVRSNERLREVIAAAREAANDVRLNYVVSAGDERSDAVVVDRGQLTDRQRETVETAYEAGYFAHPRESNAETVAEQLGVSAATFREHLATAQAKLFGSVFDR